MTDLPRKTGRGRPRDWCAKWRAQGFRDRGKTPASHTLPTSPSRQENGSMTWSWEIWREASSRARGPHGQPLAGVWGGAGLRKGRSCSEPLVLFSGLLPSPVAPASTSSPNRRAVLLALGKPRNRSEARLPASAERSPPTVPQVGSERERGARAGHRPPLEGEGPANLTYTPARREPIPVHPGDRAEPGPGRAGLPHAGSVAWRSRPGPPQQASCFSKRSMAQDGEKTAPFLEHRLTSR